MGGRGFAVNGDGFRRYERRAVFAAQGGRFFERERSARGAFRRCDGEPTAWSISYCGTTRTLVRFAAQGGRFFERERSAS
ncbi:MAG: hypothetical protein RR540_08185, partial [Oscillospiraceae bacterium]